MRISAFLVAAAAAISSVAATSNARVVSDLRALADLQSEYIPDAKAITIVNAPLIAIGQGPYPRIVDGIEEVVELTDALNHGLYSGVTTGTDTAHNDMIKAFLDFAKVQTKFLDILAAKATIVTEIPLVGQHVADALDRLKISDNILLEEFFRAAIKPSPALYAARERLSSSLEVAIEKYTSIIKL